MVWSPVAQLCSSSPAGEAAGLVGREMWWDAWGYQPTRPPAAVPLMALQLGVHHVHGTVPPPGCLLGTEKYSQW